MIYTQQCNDFVEQINELEKEFNINEEHCNEIINIYFECFSHISYDEYKKNEIRVFKKENNESIIKQLEQYEDACAFNGDNYILITNYKTIKADLGDILGDD